MKKLMTMIAAVATAFGLYAADSGTSFEGSAGKLSQVYGSLTELDTTVTETTDKAKYWSFDKDDTAEVVAFGATEGRPSERPGQYVDEGNYYLKLSSGTNLLKRNYATSGSFNAALKPLYFDSVVKMTAFDADPEITDAKLAVWLRDTSEDENVVDPATNLMVTVAGVNYNCGNRPALLETWARVTIKALSIGEKIGFAVWVNETQVTCDALSYTGVTLGNDYAKQLAAEKALFVPNADDTTITYAGFAGIGSIDDLVFTETAPSFAVDYTFKKVAWDEGVTGFTCANGQGFTFTTNGLTAAGNVTFQYTGELPAVNAASVTYAAGKMANEITNDGGVETIKSQDAGAVLTIGSETTSFATVAAAFLDLNTKYAAATTAGLKLNTGSGAVELNNANIALTLDLNGQEIKNEEGDAITVTAGALTIIDSDPNKQGKVIAGDYAVYTETAVVMIQAGTFDGGMSLGTGGSTITGGKFLIAANEKDSLNAWKPEGYEFVAKDGYWELKEITGYTLSIDPSIVNGTVTTVPAASKVEAGTTVTVTATPADGYNLGSITTNNATIAGNTFVMPEDNVVVSATFVAIQYATLTVATVENLTISVTNAAGEVQNTGAKFDKDLATVLYVTRTPASGYELDGYVATETITMSADVTVTGAVKSAAQPVNPGEEKQYDDLQKAAAAAKAINDNKEASINVPTAAAGNKTAYLERVAAKVIEGNKVVVDIAAEKEATFKGELDTEMKKTAVAAALTDATATKATIATVPGFYYWIEGGVEVGTINQNGAPKIGTGSTVELTKPTLEAAATAGKAFYKLAVGVKAP